MQGSEFELGTPHVSTFSIYSMQVPYSYYQMTNYNAMVLYKYWFLIALENNQLFIVWQNQNQNLIIIIIIIVIIIKTPISLSILVGTTSYERSSQ